MHVFRWISSRDFMIFRYFICLAGWVNGVKNRGDYKIFSDVIKEIREKSQLLHFNIGFGGSLFSGFLSRKYRFCFFRNCDDHSLIKEAFEYI